MSCASWGGGGRIWVAVALATVAATALTYRLAAHLKAARVLANLQSPADVAYNKLYAAWVELGPSFMPWWQAQGLDTRTSVMRTARDAVRAELGEAAAAMDTLCPELSDGKVARVCQDGVLSVLVDARLRDPETAEAHDERFAAANVGPGHPIQVVVAASHNRSLLLLSTLINVLVVAEQLGVSRLRPPPPPTSKLRHGLMEKH
mmetsp:Transcript_38636/g.95934  ORF Transcript_38636/g.95934 Transcript_38636/m.95934 type:complete len:204 (-) Transcript_38636:267-878(-)